MVSNVWKLEKRNVLTLLLERGASVAVLHVIDAIASHKAVLIRAQMEAGKTHCLHTLSDQVKSKEKETNEKTISLNNG